MESILSPLYVDGAEWHRAEGEGEGGGVQPSAIHRHAAAWRTRERRPPCRAARHRGPRSLAATGAEEAEAGKGAEEAGRSRLVGVLVLGLPGGGR